MEPNKICMISSAGGHYAQLKQLKNTFEENTYFIVTEINNTTSEDPDVKYYLKQQDRKSKTFFFQIFYNFLVAVKILIVEKPTVIISTGAGAVLPTIIIGKLCGVKIVFIESFAKISSPTITGKIIYKLADRFYVQWEEMQKFYPNAIYRGTIY